MITTIEIIKEQFKKRVFEESCYRIEKVLNILSDEQIWYAPNSHTNSIGNLILHLCGNVRQWIGTGIGQLPDIRYRAEEFTRINVPREELLEHLSELSEMTLPIIDRLTDKDLVQEQTVQGFEESTLSIIIHVIEHFSYHTGQIAYIAKALTDRDLGFYEGIDLDVNSNKV